MRYPGGMSREDYLQHLQDTEDDIAHFQGDTARDFRDSARVAAGNPEPTYRIETPDDFAKSESTESEVTEDEDE